jgi:hypothetical protein
MIEERFGISGVSFKNIEQVYNPMLSGTPSMSATHKHLISQGMPVHLADSLAVKYLNGLNDKTVCTIMDFFSGSNSGFDALKKVSSLEQVSLNMVPISRVSSLRKMPKVTPNYRAIRPNVTQAFMPLQSQMASARFFSTPVESVTEEDKPKSNFMDFLKKAEEADA